VATASADKTCKIWRTADLTVFKTLYGHTSALCDCAWSSDSRSLVTAADDCLVHVWDLESGFCLMILAGHRAPVLCCKYNVTNTLIVSASCDETVRLWDASSGCCISVFPAHSDPVTSVQFSADSTTLLSSSYDGICRLWDVHTSRCLKSVDICLPVGSATFTCNFQLILVTTLKVELQLWNIDFTTCIARFTGYDHLCVSSLSKISFSFKDSAVAFAIVKEGAVYFWRKEENRYVSKSERTFLGQKLDLTLLTYHGITSTLITYSSSDCSISLWQLA